MKKIALLLLLFVATQFSATSQTADEIIKTYLENIGGADALSKVTGIKMTAKVEQQGMTIPLEMVYLKGGNQIVSFEFQGKTMVQSAFNGETSWGVNFMTQKAEKNDSEDTENMKRESGDFPDAWLDYKKKGYTAEMMGKEQVEGTECFKVKLTKKPLIVEGKEEDNIVYYYFDTENYVPLVQEQEISSGNMKGQMSQTVFSDYDEVDGIYFPFSITSKLKGGEGQAVIVENITLNPKVDNSIFDFPEEN